MLNQGFQRVMFGFFVSVLCSLVGCVPSASGTFDDKGYRHATFDCRVDSAHSGDPKIAKEDLLGNDWKLDNFYYNELKTLVQKATKGYRTEYVFDTNGDGEWDSSQEDFLYDLRFKHLKRDATIWLRTLPISDDLKRKDLRVLLQRYVDEVSGAGFEAVKLGPDTTVFREKRFAANIIARGPFKLAEQDAYEATFEVANVDELAINSTARRVRVRTVLVRTPFEYTVTPGRDGLKPHHYSVLMLVGYANLPEDFAGDEKDFQQLLDHIKIGGKAGATPVALETSLNAADAKAPAAAAPAGAEPVAPSPPAAPAAPPATEAPPAPAESGAPPSGAPPQ